MDFLKNNLLNSSGYNQYYASVNYVSFLKNQDLSVLVDGVPALESSLEDAKSWMIRVKAFLYNDLKTAIDGKLKSEKNKEVVAEGKKTIERLKAQK